VRGPVRENLRFRREGRCNDHRIQSVDESFIEAHGRILRDPCSIPFWDSTGSIRKRLGCGGLSVGGYRSFHLAALDRRIKVAVDVGWMSSFASQISRHVLKPIGLSFHLVGLYRYLDLPDLAALITPRAVLVIIGSRDQLFLSEGVKSAFAKIEPCFRKAQAPERRRCSLYDAPHRFNITMQVEAWPVAGAVDVGATAVPAMYSKIAAVL
jgi:hypothetical protein